MHEPMQSRQLGAGAGETIVAGSPFDHSIGRGVRVAVLEQGSALAAIIRHRAPGADYFPIQLSATTPSGRTRKLLDEMKRAIDARMDVISVGLSVYALEQWATFQRLAERARSQGTVLVASRPGGIRVPLPGALPQVIGVDIDPDLPQNRYRVATADNGWYFFASGAPLPARLATREVQPLMFALAHMTGFVACACEVVGERRLETVREALAAAVWNQPSDAPLAMVCAKKTPQGTSIDRGSGILQYKYA